MTDWPQVPLSAHEQIAWAKHIQRVKAAHKECKNTPDDDWKSAAAYYHFDSLLREYADIEGHRE